MEKIVIALNLIIDFIDSKEKVDEREIADFLFNTGFDDYEIRQTLSVLDFNSFNGTPIFRVFTTKEKNTLTKDAIFYLQKMYLSGILDVNTLEEVIEQAVVSETNGVKVGLENIKNIILYSLLERQSIMLPEEADEDYLN